MINEVSPSSPGVNGIGSMSSVWAVVEAARAGASDARDAAANALPQTARLIRSGIHTTGFAIGFTVSCRPADAEGQLPGLWAGRRQPGGL